MSKRPKKGESCYFPGVRSVAVKIPNLSKRKKPLDSEKPRDKKSLGQESIIGRHFVPSI